MPEQTPKVTVWCIRHVRVRSLILQVVAAKEMNGKKSQMAMTSGPKPLPHSELQGPKYASPHEALPSVFTSIQFQKYL